MLVERESQLRQLHELFEECVAGNGRVAVLYGPTGSGKTELLRLFTEEAKTAGALVLNAVAGRSERDIPNEVLRQLLGRAELPPAVAGRVAVLLDTQPGEHGGDRITGSLRELGAILLSTAEDSGRPLVIAVDDVHHADVSSLQSLLFLVRRFRTSPTLLVVTEATYSQEPGRMPHAELPHPPVSRHIRLLPLSMAGVARLLARDIDITMARTHTPHAFALSGGLPPLVDALTEDYPAARHRSPHGIRPGKAYERALSGFLHRLGPSMRATAQALAVVDEPVTVEWLAELTGIPAATVARALAALDDSGLLVGGRFRDRRIGRLVREDIDRDERAALHLRTAHLLHRGGAVASVVATHLVAAERADTTLLPVLNQAAEAAMENGKHTLAEQYLRLAQRYGVTVGGPLRAETEILLLRLEWRTDPSQTLRRLPDLADAVTSGLLGGRDAITPLASLLWFGQVEKAAATLKIAEESDIDAETAAELQTLGTLLTVLYPGTRSPGSTSGSPGSSVIDAVPFQTRSSSVLSATLRAARILGGAFTDGPSAESAERAKLLLESTRLGEHTLMPILLSLLTLVANERAAVAGAICDTLIDQARTAGTATWQALLSAARAWIALRQGELELAAKLADIAVTILAPAGWGVFLGFPLAIAITAASATGDHESVVRQLRIPVPEPMFRTPIGLLYLRACGQAQYATGHYEKALDCSMAIGDLMAAWRMDPPSPLAWRTDAAHACVRLGRNARAAELAAEQVRLSPPTDRRTTAAAIRVLAATRAPEERARLLTHAVEVLSASDDRVELAAILTDLGWAQHALGEDKPAHRTLRQADRLIKPAGLAQADRTSPGSPSPQRNPAAPEAKGELTYAERRVAMLAVQGHSNRKIADQLFVTVSTVEQHLTRAYRKLNVRRRSELIAELLPRLPLSG
jgi:DNA-binding CsgD family transcriptional regulator